MDLAGQRIAVRLSQAGVRSLGPVVRAKRSFTALAVGSDAAGIWAALPEALGAPGPIPVVLLKWEHVTTVSFEMEPIAPLPPRAIGFVKDTR